MAGTCGVVGFIGKEILIKTGPAVKNKFHKLVEKIIIWEKMAAEMSIVCGRRRLLQYLTL